MSYFKSDPNPLEERVAELEARIAELPTQQDITDAVVAAVRILLDELEQE